eukprot:1179774-Prorocentrum_minimum.AAC.3
MSSDNGSAAGTWSVLWSGPPFVPHHGRGGGGGSEAEQPLCGGPLHAGQVHRSDGRGGVPRAHRRVREAQGGQGERLGCHGGDRGDLGRAPPGEQRAELSKSTTIGRVKHPSALELMATLQLLIDAFLLYAKLYSTDLYSNICKRCAGTRR